MATRVDMPQLGLTMEKGTILRWLKQEGEPVQEGEPLVLLQTEKVEYEFEALAGGVLGEGLVAPVIRDAHARSLGRLAAEGKHLAERARAGKLAPVDMDGGTFTMTNLGATGLDAFTPIINPRQAAILGVGRMVDRAVAIQGGLHVRAMTTLSLASDHRLVDGAPAAHFLAKLTSLLEDPGPWLP